MAGGIFTPLLALGALIGLALGQGGRMLLPGIVTRPEVFAVVGMAAYFAALVRAPLTGIVLIIEMTGDYNQMLPLLVACFTSYALAERLGDLLRGGIKHLSKEAVVIELEVEPESPFDGKQIRKLGLPPGCIIVNLWDGKRDAVPTATTRLEAHTRITAAIAPEAANAFEMLHHGCEANGHANP